MSVAERERLEVFSRVRDGELSVAGAAALPGVGERQAWRPKARYVRGGGGGLVHRSRGKASNRKTGAAARSAVPELYRGEYAGRGPTLACEYLAKEDDREVGHDTLGRRLREEGLFERRRKRGKHRARRPRRGRRGERVRMDGSWHDGFERSRIKRLPGDGRGPWCRPKVLVGDATGRTFARFYDRETLAAAFDAFDAFDAFGRYARACGLPRAVYVDEAGISGIDRPDPDTGEPTRFGRAMAGPGVGLIPADGPQAKRGRIGRLPCDGRVERMNQTPQDRLVKEMRLRGVSDVASADALPEGGFLEGGFLEGGFLEGGFLEGGFLEGGFLEGLNEEFAVEAKRKRPDRHRKVTAKAKPDEVLCVHEERAVARDGCVRWRGRPLQVDGRHAPPDLPRPGRRVGVIEEPDGTPLLRYGATDLTRLEVSRRPAKPKAAREPVVNNKRWTPPPGHPFRRSLGGKSPAATHGDGRTDSSIAPRTPDIPIALEHRNPLRPLSFAAATLPAISAGLPAAQIPFGATEIHEGSHGRLILIRLNSGASSRRRTYPVATRRESNPATPMKSTERPAAAGVHR